MTALNYLENFQETAKEHIDIHDVKVNCNMSKK